MQKPTFMQLRHHTYTHASSKLLFSPAKLDPRAAAYRGLHIFLKTSEAYFGTFFFLTWSLTQFPHAKTRRGMTASAAAQAATHAFTIRRHFHDSGSQGHVAKKPGGRWRSHWTLDIHTLLVRSSPGHWLEVRGSGMHPVAKQMAKRWNLGSKALPLLPQ